ncbi:hypothetical protein QN219_25555, partial [Sinorhizobium sp. 7-81]|nr:hypothetical protein [Sinorhizobium sp. 8-89]
MPAVIDRSHTVTASPENFPSDFQRLVPGGSVRTSAGTFVRPVNNGGQWAVIVGVPSTTPYFFT